MRRFMHRHMSVAILVMALLALAACGGAATDTGNNGGAAGDGDAETDSDTNTDGGTDSNTNTGGGAIDLCAVLSLDEISEATGVEVTDTLDASSGDVSSCNYNTSDNLPAAGHTYLRGGGAIDPGQMIDANVEGAEEISGIGERAILVGDENFPILMVLKNNGLYSLSVLADNLDAAGKREATIELARKAVDRLP